MVNCEEIIYFDEKIPCHGFLCYDSAQTAPTPCVIVAHDWSGRTRRACQKAKQLAQMGYIGFALDIYGQAKIGTNKLEKRVLMTPFREDRNLLAKRVLAAYSAVAALPQVNKNKIAAIGYCFGGLCVLDLARTAVDLKGAVSFHGLLSAPPQAIFTTIPAKILVLHGYDDPLVLPAEVNAFAEEMTKRQADWQIHLYGRTAHSFTDPTANDPEMGLHYNKRADYRSWQATLNFLEEIFT